jgi:hypothetical protein
VTTTEPVLKNDRLSGATDASATEQDISDSRQLARAPLEAGQALAGAERREIEVFYLSSYAPELNPDELLELVLSARTGSK